MLSVNVFNEQEDLTVSPTKIQELVCHVLEKEGCVCDEVNVYLVDTASICSLHEEFFHDPSPTDCISFPIDDSEDFSFEGEDKRMLGEIFVCPKTAIEYASKEKKDPYQETTLYIIHSLLHLMGYRDSEDEEIQLMRQAEERHLTHLQDIGWKS